MQFLFYCQHFASLFLCYTVEKFCFEGYESLGRKSALSSDAQNTLQFSDIAAEYFDAGMPNFWIAMR